MIFPNSAYDSGLFTPLEGVIGLKVAEMMGFELMPVKSCIIKFGVIDQDVQDYDQRHGIFLGHVFDTPRIHAMDPT